MAPAETKKADGSVSVLLAMLVDVTNHEQPSLEEGQEMLDLSAFEQILEMDDDDDRDFSKGIVFGFFDQAMTTFEQMETAMYVTFLVRMSCTSCLT